MSCGKEDVTPSPSPEWMVEIPAQYEGSMSAIVTLPAGLIGNGDVSDKMAAFINAECRGEGQVVDAGSNIYFMIIKANENETEKISFRYYSAKNQRLYTTQPIVSFSTSENYGTADEPEVLPLEAMK